MAKETKDKETKETEETGPKTTTYRVKAGLRHFADGELRTGGQEVELTDAQYKAFGDKFDKVDAKPQVEQDTPTGPPADGSGSGAGAVGATHVPQDVGAATRDPELPNVNPGNVVPIVGPPSGAVALSVAPGRSAANTSAATGSPLSPPPVANTVIDVEPNTKNKPDSHPSETGSKK